ncbi:MAG: tetratricopeptide repeat protein [Deltaproteobacteria bacterium]|nr:tetratricopeptide repeat protein [Deltaproteobacteria bacterium]
MIPPAATADSRGSTWLLGLLGVVVLTFALYARTLPYDYVMDDTAYIGANPAVTVGAPLASYFNDRHTIAANPTLQSQSYRPLRTLAYRVLWVLGNGQPWFFRAANLVAYAAEIVLLFVLLLRLGAERSAALAAVALWALLPVHVEPVVYPSSFGDHLSLVLELGAIILSLRICRAGFGQRATLAAALGLSAAGMLVKEMAMTVGPIVAVCALATAEERSPALRRRVVLLTGLHLLVAALFFALRTRVIAEIGHAPLEPRDVLRALAETPLVVGAYLHAALMPLGHHPAYVMPSVPPWGVSLAWLAMGGAGLVLYQRGGLARAGALFFAVSLLPVLRYIPLAANYADRFALVPTLGLAFIVSFGIARLLTWWPRGGIVALALLASVYAAGTWVEQPAWRNDVTLWRKAYALAPQSYLANKNLGVLAFQQGRVEEALRFFNRANALGSESAAIHFLRASALYTLGRMDEARAAARASARIPGAPGGALALHGVFLVKAGKLEVATRVLGMALRADPEHEFSWLLRADLAAARGDRTTERAALEYLRSLMPEEAVYTQRLQALPPP